MRRLGPAFAVALCGVAAAASPLGFGLEQQIGLGSLFALRGTREPPASVAVVGVDPTSTTLLRKALEDGPDPASPLGRCERRVALGPDDVDIERMNLSRRIYACVVDELRRRAVPVVVFDVEFLDDRHLEPWPEKRPMLASRVPVGDGEERRPGTAELARAIRDHGSVALVTTVHTAWVEEGGSLVLRRTVRPLRPEIAAAASAIAVFELPRAAGGGVLDFSTGHNAQPRGEQLPTAALRLFAAATNRPEVKAASERAGRSDITHTLNLFGPAGSVPTVPVAELLLQEDGAESALGKEIGSRVVFVGQTHGTDSLDDQFVTGWNVQGRPRVSGVELAATAFDNLLQGNPLRAPPEALRLAIVLAFGLIAGLVASWGTIVAGTLAVFALGAMCASCAIALFAFSGIRLPFVVPLVVVVPSALLLGAIVRYRLAERWLSRWGPRALVEQLLSGRDSAMRPRDCELTVMFVDIVGFTSISESLPPARVRRLLDAHCARLIPLIEAEAGTVGDLAGDCVMAYWGAPEPHPDHAVRACRAARAIAGVLRRQPGNAAPEQLHLRVRIGVDSGSVSIGDEGGSGRGAYRLCGDTVNTAQRLEQLGKIVDSAADPAVILVSERTARLAGNFFAFDSLGERELAGRDHREHVYRLDPGGVPAERTLKAS